MNTIPQHLSILTIGTRDLVKIREFYGRWGWIETDGSESAWCAFDVGGVLLSFYSIEELASEIKTEPTPSGVWNGLTLALNLADQVQLDAVFDAAIRAGATKQSDIQPREWGGMSGYITDPDGNYWELATGGPNPALS